MKSNRTGKHCWISSFVCDFNMIDSSWNLDVCIQKKFCCEGDLWAWYDRDAFREYKRRDFELDAESSIYTGINNVLD